MRTENFSAIPSQWVADSGVVEVFGKHSHGDSKLTCVDCGEQICAKCFVQCPVGFRCRNCSSKFQSHLIVVSPWIMIRTVLSCIALGSIYGFVLPSEGLSFFGFIIPYFVGALCGKIIHKIAGYKLGAKVIASITAGLLIGMTLSPISSSVYIEIVALTSAPKEAAREMTGLIYTIGPAIIFVFGVLSPILYGYRRS